MSETSRHDSLINTLGAELVPVRRLSPPWRRTLGWLLVVLAIAAVLLMRNGFAGMERRWAGTPDLAWAGIGAVITMVSAAWAAFALGVPGRSSAWAWLPLPGVLLWLSASGLGCMRDWIAPDTHAASMHEAGDCLFFIIGFSLPLSALLVLLLRRAYPMRPVLTAVLIGLASAAASASLLEICHSYDSTVKDLLMHAIAVSLVIGVNAAMGGRLLQRQ